MSERGPTTNITSALRRLREDVDQILRGITFTGRVSFGDTIRIGGADGVDITVVRLPGGAKQLVFTNAVTGTTSTINL